MMVNSIKLKEKMKKCGVSQNELANKLNLSLVSVNRKLNAKTPMTLADAEGISKILGICDSEFGEYFFHDFSCSTQQIT